MKWNKFIDNEIEMKFKYLSNKDDIRQAGLLEITKLATNSNLDSFSDSVIESLIKSAMRKEANNRIKEVILYGGMFETHVDTRQDLESDYIKQEFWEEIKKHLTEKEFNVIWSVFKEGKTDVQIAKEWDVSKQYIGELKHGGFKKLKGKITKDWMEG